MDPGGDVWICLSHKVYIPGLQHSRLFFFLRPEPPPSGIMSDTDSEYEREMALVNRRKEEQWKKREEEE